MKISVYPLPKDKGSADSRHFPFREGVKVTGIKNAPRFRPDSIIHSKAGTKKGLNHTLVHHGISHFQETGNIGTFNVIDIAIVFRTIFNTGMMD